ncbi:hypothetical protein A0H81_09621 [Grifola frondosa]|uniref:Uncharacterized protein n=1 Tax=Grifola frondosa TaxID=5627 RepID=A0A1C7M091_GRIFR|nr:hypothetical protein A0H81_09621 [Grifola frondosa]
MASGSLVELSSTITPYSSSIFSESRFQEHLDENHKATSPMDSALLMQFPLPSTSDGHSPTNAASLPRIIVTHSETRLEGPDNAMARVARAKITAREAELTQRVREMEKTLLDKYSATASSSTETSQSASPTDVPGPRRTVSVKSDTSESEIVLRGQVDALREEMERMRTLQQQMALELRDATEPPPEYQ